jgi:hypothetical protein
VARSRSARRWGAPASRCWRSSRSRLEGWRSTTTPSRTGWNTIRLAPRWSSSCALQRVSPYRTNPYKIEVTLDTDLNQQPASWLDPARRQEGDRQVLSGTVELYYRTSSRLLVFRFPDGRDRIFRLGLAAKPDPDDGWSDWRPVDFVGLPGQPQTAKPGPEDTFALRYRVRVWGSE